jgi:hypothetical protein
MSPKANNQGAIATQTKKILPIIEYTYSGTLIDTSAPLKPTSSDIQG